MPKENSTETVLSPTGTYILDLLTNGTPLCQVGTTGDGEAWAALTRTDWDILKPYISAARDAEQNNQTSVTAETRINLPTAVFQPQTPYDLFHKDGM